MEKIPPIKVEANCENHSLGFQAGKFLNIFDLNLR